MRAHRRDRVTRKTAEERQLRLQRLSAIQWEKLATEHEHTWLMFYVLLPQFIQLAQARPMMQCTCLVVMLVWHKDHHCMTPPCTHNHVFLITGKGQQEAQISMKVSRRFQKVQIPQGRASKCTSSVCNKYM